MRYAGSNGSLFCSTRCVDALRLMRGSFSTVYNYNRIQLDWSTKLNSFLVSLTSFDSTYLFALFIINFESIVVDDPRTQSLIFTCKFHMHELKWRYVIIELPNNRPVRPTLNKTSP